MKWPANGHVEYTVKTLQFQKCDSDIDEGQGDLDNGHGH